MKKYILIRKKKNSRGVAVIFTLGILGLLTVMALGFASTALLNRKIAENTSSSAYARHIAKNIAFARARWAVMTNALSETVYTSSLSAYSDANGKTKRDFLYRMDTLLDGVEIYRVTDDSGAILDNTARWQYVTDPDDNNRILGRYAYAVVPDCGRLDPNINRGSVATRSGSSEKEVKLPGTAWSGIPDLGANRWKSFYEIMKTADITDAATKRTFFSDGIGINQQPESETFWVDLNKDGKRTKDEMFLRFNMTRDWTTTTVDQLIGKDSEALTLATAGGAASNSFIPWLKYWDYQHDVYKDPDDSSKTLGWKQDAMKKQIAANIIQSHLSDTAETLADGPADWLSSTSASHPTYAGIGRHPMLNEIGFLVRVSTDVSFGTVTESDDKTKIKATYTPTFHITIDVGAELIYPFGPASDLDKNVEISFSGKSHSNSSVTFNDTVLAFELRKFRTASKPDASHNAQKTVESLGGSLFQPADILNKEMFHSDLDHISIRADGNWGKHITSTSTAINWENGDSQDFKLTFEPSDWKHEDGKPVYTLAGKFWKQAKTSKQYKLNCTIRNLEIETPKNGKASLSKEAEYIASAIARRMTIEWKAFTPGTVVLKYGDKQRDIVYQLENKTPSNAFAGTGISGWYDMAGEEASPEKIWFISYEAADPLVNHYQKDWKTNLASPEVQNYTAVDEGRLTSHGYYPGSLAGSDGNETADSHINNSAISGKLPFNQTINGTAIQETATDPAYKSTKRLSTSYIRHGQMQSLWELGFISRAEAFRTLNLARTKIFEPSLISDLKAGSFADGDANILDQVKMSDTNSSSDDKLYKYGKISLNSNNHNVFQQVFNTDVNWYETLRASAASEPFSTTPTASSAVCSDANCKAMSPCDLSAGACSHSSCLAHLLLDRSSILPFSNRSDLLVEPTAANLAKLPGYSALSATQKANLLTAQTNLRNFLLKTGDTATLCKAEKEQYAARFMHLFSTGTNRVKRVYVIVVAQSIRDIGGVPALVDWNGDGEYSSSAVTIPTSDNAEMRKFLRTGYIRKKLFDSSNYEKIGTETSVNETIASPAVGTYDYGADKITGETKLIVEMQKDIFTNKWQITGYRYVE